MLYLAWTSVLQGNLNPDLLSLSPGPISHARWLTLALRCLLLWMSDCPLDREESKSLKVIVHFIVTNYCPQWFAMKQRSSLEHGPKHLYNQIQALTFLRGKALESAKENVLRNAYYAHSELLLTAMLADKDPEVRRLGVEKILCLRRESNSGDKSVRPFKVPKVNLKCKSYADLIDWDQEEVTEPIITADFTLDDLEKVKHTPIKLDKFPCHSQGCERAVKETSRASAKVVGWVAKDGFFHLSGLCRNLMKKFASKKDFIENIVD